MKGQAELIRIFALADYAEQLAAFPQTVFVSPDILADLADSKTPQGIVAEIALDQEEPPASLSGRCLFLEDVQDPGNVGTMIRTADAAGFDAVVISSHSADIYSLKTLRSMQGSHFHLPVYRMETAAFIALARASHLPLLATTLSEDSLDYRELSKPEKFVLVMGNEGQGISPEIADAADVLVHISMKGQAESLNVAVAAGILIFFLS
ncbi:rRNA methylase [Streptococcus sp. DD11]|nr:rRNA methylase [Streptococcus sp. DD11]